MTETVAAKRQLRETMRHLRKAITPAEKAVLDAAMCRQFLRSTLYQTCSQLFCFVSLPGEPDTAAILQAALADGKCVAVPRCMSQQQMQFYRLLPEKPLLSQLEPGTYGVLEPLQELPYVEPQKALQPLCLVPGLAFDRKGGRLGYGAGYYDRFLAANAFLIKIGYAASRFVVEHVPVEPTDVRLDGIATEEPLEVWNG